MERQVSDKQAAAFGREIVRAAARTRSREILDLINDGGVILDADEISDKAAAKLGHDVVASIIASDGAS